MTNIGGREVSMPLGFPPIPDEWAVSNEEFASSDKKVTLFGAMFSRPKVFRALVVVHGMGEHGGRYQHLPHFLEKTFDAIYVFDLQGHGRSGGARGHIGRMDALVDDVAMVVRKVHADLVRHHGQIELHLLGHSLGGLLTIRTLFLHPNLPLKSAAVSAPFLALHPSVSPLVQKAALGLSHIWPSMPLKTNLDATGLSRDPEVVRHYKEDPLNHGAMTPGFFRELMQVFADTAGRHDGIRVPFLMMVPLSDRIVGHDQSLKFFEQLRSPGKVLKTYPEFFHEIFNDRGKERVFEDFVQFLQGK